MPLPPPLPPPPLPPLTFPLPPPRSPPPPMPPPPPSTTLHLQLSFSRSVPVPACVRLLRVRLLVPPVCLRAALSPCVLCVPSSATCNSPLTPSLATASSLSLCLFARVPVCVSSCVARYGIVLSSQLAYKAAALSASRFWQLCAISNILRLGSTVRVVPLTMIHACTADWNERVGIALCLPARSAQERETWDE